MTEPAVVAVFADGGIIGRNPSKKGGTWAWCHVDASDNIVRSASGSLLPARHELLAITNNQSEYAALARAIRELPHGWSGRVFSDSQVTLGRFFWGWRHTNIPPSWEIRMRELVGRLGKIEAVLLDGHPTLEQLESGIGKRGNPVSRFNVWCDEACREVYRR